MVINSRKYNGRSDAEDKGSARNIEMQHWLLNIQLREEQQTARKDNAVTNSSILSRFCMVLKKQDEELSAKPMKRFLMANEHSPGRIEKLLFKNVAPEATGF